MTKNEKLRDLEQGRAGLLADRDQLVRTCNSRVRRTKLVGLACDRIRSARRVIEQAMNEIRQVRSASEYPGGKIYSDIDARDARIQSINKELVTLRAEARIERLLAMMSQINTLEKELSVGNPDAVSDDDIV